MKQERFEARNECVCPLNQPIEIADIHSPSGSIAFRSIRKSLELRKGTGMARLTAAMVALITAGTFAATASAKIPNPRKCILNSARACAEEAAVTAVRLNMSARTGHPYTGHGDIRWTSDLTCTTTSPKFLLWRCAWTAGGAGKATVRFWATSAGWHRQVVVTLA